MSKHTPHPTGYIMVLISSILFGTYGVWSKLMGGEFGIFFQGWVRSAIILLLLLPVMLFTKSFQRIKREDWKWLACILGATVCSQVPLYYAFVHASIGTVTLLFYAMYTVTSYLIGRFFLGEAITKAKIFAIILALTGLVLTFGFSLAKFSVLGLLLATLNGVASGGDVSFTKKVTDKYPPLLITFYVWAAIFITHLPLSVMTHEKQWIPAWNKEWIAIVLYAVVGMVAFWLVVAAYRFVDASLGSLLGLTEIIWGVLFGAWFFHEHAGPTVWVGGGLILLAGMLPDLANLLHRNKEPEAVEPLRQM